MTEISFHDLCLQFNVISSLYPSIHLLYLLVLSIIFLRRTGVVKVTRNTYIQYIYKGDAQRNNTKRFELKTETRRYTQRETQTGLCVSHIQLQEWKEVNKSDLERRT